MPGSRLLLIEHEASLRDVLGACLGDLGDWEVTSSQSIQEGITLCHQYQPDVILVDDATPEANALSLMEQLKRDSQRQAIPIILISAKADWFTVSELHQMGFLGAISKPFNPFHLSAKIHRMVSCKISPS